MNQEQRKYLRLRLSVLKFRPYHDHEDDTPAITKLREEIADREKKISVFEKVIYNKKQKVLPALEKVKNIAFELIYGNDFDKALESVKSVEKKYEEARARKYGSPANSN